jgi:hypothetical protein
MEALGEQSILAELGGGGGGMHDAGGNTVLVYRLAEVLCMSRKGVESESG